MKQNPLNTMPNNEGELPQSGKRSRPGACACQKTLLTERVSQTPYRRQGTKRSANLLKKERLSEWTASLF